MVVKCEVSGIKPPWLEFKLPPFPLKLNCVTLGESLDILVSYCRSNKLPKT